MRKQIAIMSFGLVLALVLSATSAWAADEDLRAVIRDEIQQYQQADKKKDGNNFKAYWKDGIRLDTNNKKVKIKLGGRLMLDFWAVDDSDFPGAIGPSGSDTWIDVRRARFYFAGELYKHVEFKLQVDFQNPNNPEFRDAYIGIKNLRDCWGCGVPRLRVGNMKVPFSLEELTSSRYITFMERSAPTNAFAPARRFGLQFFDVFRGGQFGYNVMAFTFENSDSFANDGGAEIDDGWGVAGRLWWAPWYDCACKCKRLHLGVAAYYGDDVGNTGSGLNNRPRFRARGGYGQGARLVNTGRLTVDDLLVIGAEVAFVYGPWSVQGEYMIANVNRPTGQTDPTFTGWYAQASYWLTGECRPYKAGVFGRVKPCCNFLDNDCCCKGGWELAARYSFTDLEDSGVTGGEMGVFTFGVNWHLNPNARIMLNVIYDNVDGGPLLGNNINNNGNLWGVGMRWQVDW